MDYRLYKDGDFPALYAIEEQCFQPPFRFSRAYMRQLIRNSDGATWIAEEEGRMTGFALVEWQADVAYIQTLEVAPSDRRRGIGERLLARLESSARKAGATIVGLHVAEQNLSAIKLYERNGYQRQGREADYYARGVHALIYAKTVPKEDVDEGV